ncbi:probable protein phosphatase 2C 28 isoform X1 [Ricinus communis]|uniref:probable protein phosphatase 2C 28 isoform X1 n=1 Tax=Ricinus communis TaxID=3988 RepID=UPI00201AD027|nr:probable protein phosphatase 2C 28 isoform X1 [Ricinus communis]
MYLQRETSILSDDGISILPKKTRYTPLEELSREVPEDFKETGDDSSIEEENDAVEEEEEEEEEEPSSKHTRHGYHMVRGKMDHGMEDYVVAEKRKINGHNLGLYAIFDGHSGRDVAKYLQSHLFDNILNEPNFWKNPKGAIRKAYKNTDDEILDGIVGSRGGSTAVTAILIDQEKLIIANVGDSRAVLCRNGVAKQLSVDHEPQKERELVESRGGFVSKKPGSVPRVDGQLAMTRAFGDGRLKDHITSEPNLIAKIIDKGVEFLILASDGLWKVMSNQEAYDCIRDLEDAQEAAEKLIAEALVRGSMDDISCIVVTFG